LSFNTSTENGSQLENKDKYVITEVVFWSGWTITKVVNISKRCIKQRRVSIIWSLNINNKISSSCKEPEYEEFNKCKIIDDENNKG